jgi:hypothetical protein
MDKKEKWAEEVLQSIEELERATPPDALFAKINNQLPKHKKTKIIPLHKIGWAAAAACILISANIFAFSSSINEYDTNEQATLYENQLLTDYEIYE